ncbi:MAG: EamA family transporter [Actinobacteria bacterium]|nr:EamA family transporter [Actinomycetota bacterium]
MVLDPTSGVSAREGLRRMDLPTVLLLLTSIALATAGQLLLKAGMNEVGGELGLADLGHLLRTGATTWQVLAGLAAFGTSAVFWLLTLSRVPLSTAYPIVSLSYLLILGFSVLVLDERPSATVWVGAGLIMSGISLIGIGER